MIRMASCRARIVSFCLSAAASLIPGIAGAETDWLDGKHYPARLKAIY
jgi:hypothetical protein